MMVYMEVTQDEYELPVAIADSPKLLAEISQTTQRNVSACASRVAHGKLKRGRFVRVKIDDEGGE